MRKTVALLLLTGFICGCAVGPNYKRPKVDTPPTYRGLTPEEAARNDVNSFANEKWWTVFRDEKLQDLIKTALQQNYDVRIAAARILEAQARLGITRANQFPKISGGASTTNQRSAKQTFLPAIETSTHRVDLAFDWDLDFWGKFRRATEAARANLVATEWARREVITELIANVARYHRGKLPRSQDKRMRDLAPSDRRAVKTLAGIVRLAESFEELPHQALSNLKVKKKPGVIAIYVRGYSSLSGVAERIAAARHLLEATYGKPIIVRAARD